jgi:hypothetical protein
MKKLILLFATIGLLVFSCTDDLQKDIDDLKDRVGTLEASETVVSLEFQGNDLIVTYGDGNTASITAPVEVIPDHVSDFSIDQETNLITITFSDGTSSQYTVFSNGNATYMSGTLAGDYGITSMTMGDVTLANLAYDGQNRMVEAMINLPDGNGNVINVLELHNNYAAANPTAIAISKSMYADIDYSTEEYLSSEYVNFPGDSGYSFIQKDSEMYIYYTDRYYTGMDYRYNSRPYCWFVKQDDVDHDSYEKYFPVPGEDSLFYKSYNNYSSMDIDDVYGYLYYPSEIIKVTDIYQAGEARDTAKTRLTMRGDDLIEKVEVLAWDSDEVEGYFDLNYDNDQLVTSIDFYDVRTYSRKSASEEEPLPEHYMSMNMTYTASLLTSLSVDYFDQEGTVEETIEIGQMVYDDAGNPVEIWSSELYYYDDNGPNFTVDAGGKISIEPKNNELKKIVEIEYNYTLPNFFGKTLEYLIPELKGLSIKNAPVRITQSGSFNFAQMEYFDFNEGGYPAKVKLDANMQSYYNKSASISRSPIIPLGSEIELEYILFE